MQPLARRLAGDLAVAAAAALAVLAVLGGFRGEARPVHLALVVATAVGAGVIAGFGVMGGRALHHPRPVWVGAAFALYGATAVFLPGLGPRDLERSPGIAVAVVVADLVVVGMLLVSPHPPQRLGRWGAWLVAGLGLVLAIGAGAVPGMPVPALQVLAAVGWVLVAGIALVSGWRLHQRITLRVGVGYGLLAAAHLVRLAGGPPDDLVSTGWQLIGVLIVLVGCAGRLDREVRTLLDDREEQHFALAEAARHAARAADIARERDHEMANGLAGLSGITFLLERAGPEAAALRSMVLSELSRLHGLLDPDRPAPQEEIDLVAVLTELAALRRAAGADVQVSGVPGAHVVGPRDAFVQLVVNLLGNCERHAPGSPVRVTVTSDGRQVLIEVRDSGPGVEPGGEHVVTRRGTTLASTGGSGLGLDVSTRLAAELGGRLQVLPPDPARPGFAVRIALPLAPSSVVAPADHRVETR